MAQYEITNIPAPIDFECNSSYVKRTVQNCKNLLMCQKGEVPFDRQRGFDPALYDRPIAEIRNALLPELDRVMLWEPNAEVVRGTVELENGEAVIRCVIEIADT